MVARTGMTAAEAAAVLEKQADGLLLSSVELEFDDPDLGGATVADVLDDPVKFAGETLADPIEGREDGPCKAIVMIGGDGVPFINCFAHGHTIYRLRYDAAAVRARACARATDAVAELVRLAGHGRTRTRSSSRALVHEVARRRAAGVRDIRAMLKAAAKERRARRMRRHASGRRPNAATRAPRSCGRSPMPRGCR